jgi:pyridoxine 5-phosphate synthase
MARLCVNVDHVATVREARKIDMPDPLEAALIAEKAGCAGITVHLREDRRHIQDRDVRAIRGSIKTKLNLEMATAPEIVEFALRTRPDQVTFVPERRQEVTTEGGLDVTARQKRMRGIIDSFRAKGITVSLFIDPEPDQVRAAVDVGADAVELNTGQYSEAGAPRKLGSELKKIRKAARLSDDLSLVTHAGHGLNLANVEPIASIPVIEELNIGHSIVGRAIMVGFYAAVTEMRKAIRSASSKR